MEAFLAFGEGGHVREDEFGVDDFDVANGVDGSADVMDVIIFEAAHDLDDGVDFSDVGEELVTESFAGAGAADEAGDVNELDGGGDDAF